MNRIKILVLFGLCLIGGAQAQEANICSSLSLSDATISKYAQGLCAAGASMQNALTSQAQSEQVESPNSALGKLTLGSAPSAGFTQPAPAPMPAMPSPQINQAAPSTPAQSSTSHGGLYSYS